MARCPAGNKVLQCNNTAIRAHCLIKHAGFLEAVLPRPGIPPIVAPMSEEDDLARRFFALWAEYLAALVADPKMTESLRGWLAVVAGALPEAAPGDARAGAHPGSAAHAAAAAGASGECDAAVAELARRVDELCERVAALERTRKPGRRPAGGARRRNPRARP
jgi:hypothetical protein